MLMLPLFHTLSWIITLILVEAWKTTQLLFRAPVGCEINYKFLFNETFGTYIVHSKGLCVAGCAANAVCNAANIKEDDDSMICELGYVTESSACDALTSAVGYSYLEKHMVCFNGGRWNFNNGNCTCTRYYYGELCENKYPQDCKAVYDTGSTTGSYVLKIQPTGYPEPFDVLCDMAGGGLTTIDAHRTNLDISFHRSWADYRDGFGSISIDGSFFLGLEKIRAIANGKNSTLLVGFTTSLISIIYYHNFRIDLESHGYALHYNGVTIPTGSRMADGFGLGMYGSFGGIKGRPFCTFDKDCDMCAASTSSGWWFGVGCSGVNLHTAGGILWPDATNPLNSKIGQKYFRMQLL